MLDNNLKDNDNLNDKLVSFSDVDEKGNFKEVIGYFENDNFYDKSFEERIKEMEEKLKKR